MFTEYSRRKTPYTMEAFGIPIQPDETVYPPETDEITLLYFENNDASMLYPEVRALDFGTSSGILAIFAAKQGALVTAIDINPKAVECAKYNCKINGVSDQVQIMVSVGFSKIPQDSTFDIILASTPSESVDADSNTMEVAFYDPKFKARINLFDTRIHHLTRDGCIPLSYSPRVERINPMKSFSEHFNFETVHQFPTAGGNEENYLIKATKKFFNDHPA